MPFEIERSTYNEAMLNIQRLNVCWIKCRQYRPQGKYHEWRCELDNVWSELCQDVVKRRLKNFNHTKIKRFKILTNYLKALKEKNYSKMYNHLSELEELLRIIQDQVGKGGIYDDGYSEFSD